MTSVRSLQDRGMATRQVAFYSGVTDGSGTYSETFSPAFSTPPLVFINVSGGDGDEMYDVTNDENGFTVNISVHPALVVLGLSVIGSAHNPVSGRRVDVAVIGV